MRRRRRGGSSAFTTAPAGRNGNYSATEIDTWARRIAQWRRRETVYAYFNNDWHGFAPANALLLARKLGSAA